MIQSFPTLTLQILSWHLLYWKSWTFGEGKEEEKHHSETSWKALEKGEDMQKQEAEKREKCESKKYFPFLVTFAQGRLIRHLKSLTSALTGQISIAQIHSSIYSFIHLFIQLLTKHHCVLSMVLGIENSMVIKKLENFALVKLPF